MMTSVAASRGRRAARPPPCGELGLASPWPISASSGCASDGFCRLTLDRFRAAEAVHPECPLQSDERAFDARQEPEAQDDQEGKPDDPVDPGLGRIGRLDCENA